MPVCRYGISKDVTICIPDASCVSIRCKVILVPHKVMSVNYAVMSVNSLPIMIHTMHFKTPGPGITMPP